MHQFMQHARITGLVAAAALAVTGSLACKSETFQTPGADQEELMRQGGPGHRHSGAEDKTFGMPGATDEEVKAEQREEPPKKSTLSTPAESHGEAKEKGLTPERPGQGGGPQSGDAGRERR